MAMLGKRFQRTISMSQICPGSNVHAEKAQAHPTPINIPSAVDPPAVQIKPLTLCDSQKINDQMLLQAATTQWEALKARQQEDLHHHHHHHHHLHVHQQKASSNPWEALKGFAAGSPPPQDYLYASLQKQQEPQPSPGALQWEILKNAEAMMMMMMMQSGSHDSSVVPSIKDDDHMVMATSPIAAHLHMGLWPNFPNPASTSPSSSRAHFLDACFLCKRRLRHERDIFIYRGDAAFCSEECRHRQILCDETLSLRASKKGGGSAPESITT